MEGTTIVLVEGISDQIAVETLAVRRDHDLESQGISVVPIGGAQAAGRALDGLVGRSAEIRLAGLYDAPEEGAFRRGLERAGLGSALTRAAMEELGFFVCVADLEDELIRALGAPAVEAVLEANGDLGCFARCSGSPSGAAGRPANSFGASWAAGRGGRSATRVISSTRSISRTCRARSIACSRTPQPSPALRSEARARSSAG